MQHYVMRQNVKTRMEHQNGQPLRCRVCGEEIAVGDPVVRTAQKTRPIPLYHERCYEATLH